MKKYSLVRLFLNTHLFFLVGCLVGCLVDRNIFAHTHKPLTTDQATGQTAHQTTNQVIIAPLNGITYFATTYHPSKLHLIECDNHPRKKITRFTPTIDAWYANHCTDNAVLNALTDSVIHHFQEHAISHVSPNGKSRMIVFDIDETALSPYFFVKNETHKHAAAGTMYDHNKHPQPEEFIPLKPIKRLYDFFVKNGFKIAFVTARSDALTINTLNDLLHHDYKAYETCILMPSWFELPAYDYKDLARKNLALTYDIILTIDDDYRNLQGQQVGTYALWLPTPLQQRPDEENFLAQLMHTAHHNN